MDVIIILVFISLVLVTGAVLLLFVRLKEGDFEHGDRLSLLPLESEEVTVQGHEGGGLDGE